ncbi:adenylate kinase isoenzyme 6 [Leptopilina heterotoma]|uniref:adenylate kinase isoenzyme 6 n=1 Tax=Leptopilina heterotoma TaxID=63436 RepID=UPI001CA8C949|nr:adenylate kinase isoenzyme 6 [Leptopilina heterotoma]
MRKNPNILVTGTPGVGKSKLSEKLATRTELEWLDVSSLAKQYNCLEEFDEQYQCQILNEEKLLDIMEGLMEKGGKIVDYHGAEFFPERWFDIVFVLRTDNTVLYDRLVARGYKGKKLEDNIDCEIFQTILEEAKESYKEEIVYELTSNTPDQMESNINRICQWIQKWKIDNEGS